MPNRIIKESICESRGLSEVSFFANDLYKRLITYADDYGRFNADCQILLARLYPRELGIVKIEDIEDAVTELIGVGKIALYTSTGRKEVYGAFPNWSNHQRIRESKKKSPDPDDSSVNDWYLRRYIPKDMKVQIIERDNFKCQECGKYICPSGTTADRLVKMGAGLFHIDHIVPVQQGGRATLENLRLTCPSCNLKRKKKYFYDEIMGLPFTDCGELPQVAANCGLNPIQSKSESEYESNRNPTREKFAQESAREAFDVFWAAYPKKVGKKDAFKAFQKVPVSERPLLIPAIERQKQSRQWNDEGGRFIPNPSTWLNQGRWMDEGIDDSIIIDRPKSRVAQELEESYDIIKQWVKEEKARSNDD